MFFPHKTNWYLLRGFLNDNVEAIEIDWFDMQNSRNETSCPHLGAPEDENYNWYHDYTYSCVKYYKPGKIYITK